MCGRFVMIESEEKVMQTFEIQQSELVLEPRYNICPAQDIPVIVQQNRLRSLEMHQWGLIPFWAKDPKPMINARAETAMVKPLFRQAFRKRHCLILASGGGVRGSGRAPGRIEQAACSIRRRWL